MFHKHLTDARSLTHTDTDTDTHLFQAAGWKTGHWPLPRDPISCTRGLQLISELEGALESDVAGPCPRVSNKRFLFCFLNKNSLKVVRNIPLYSTWKVAQNWSIQRVVQKRCRASPNGFSLAIYDRCANEFPRVGGGARGLGGGRKRRQAREGNMITQHLPAKWVQSQPEIISWRETTANNLILPPTIAGKQKMVCR